MSNERPNLLVPSQGYAAARPIPDGGSRHGECHEAAYRRGYVQGAVAALDAVFDQQLPKARCIVWENAILDWRARPHAYDHTPPDARDPVRRLGDEGERSFDE